MAYTPYFLSINGLNIDVADADASPDDVEVFGRGGGLQYTGTTYGNKRKASFDTIPLLPHEADSLDGWVKGRGHQWRFAWTDTSSTTTVRFTLHSAEGGMSLAPVSSATLRSEASTAGPWGGTDGFSLMLHPGNSVTATVAFGTEAPYSLSVWRQVPILAATWELCSLAYDGATTRYWAGADGATLTTAFSWLSISAASGRAGMTLQGENNTAGTATALFSGLWIVPYALSTSMLVARDLRATNGVGAEPAFPYVGVGGSFLREVNELTMKGFIQKRNPMRVSMGGSWYANAERLSGSLVQK